MARVKDSKRSREDILKAAEEAFSRKGLYGTRVDEIAAVANINKRMIYEYFGCKNDLYKEVLKLAYNRIGNHGRSIIRADMGYDAAIRSVVTFYFDYLSAHPTYVDLILWENLNRGEFISELELAGIEQPVLHELQHILERDRKDGVIRADFDPKQIIITLLTSTFAYFSNKYTLSVILQYDLKIKQSIEKKANDLADMMIAYIQK
jgi:AcrR family transcriptional regulator